MKVRIEDLTLKQLKEVCASQYGLCCGTDCPFGDAESICTFIRTAYDENEGQKEVEV